MRYALALLAAMLFASQANGQTVIGTTPFGTTAQNISATLDASDEKLVWIVSVPTSGTIDSVLIRLGTVTEEDTLRVAIQTVNTSGKDSGTDYGGSAAGTVTFADGDDNTTQAVTLGTPATAVAGDVVAIVIDYSSYTDGNLQVYGAGNGTGGQPAHPAWWNYKDPTYTASSSGVPMLLFHYSDGAGSYKVPAGCFPPGNIAIANIQSDTDPDEIAIQFTAPVGCRLTGFYFRPQDSGTTAEVDFDVLSNAATPLSLLTNPTTITHDTIKTWQQSSFGLEPESLDANQVVNVAIFNNDSTNNFSVGYIDVADAAHWGDWAPDIAWASRQRTTDGDPDAGPAFTVLDTRKPLGGVIVDTLESTGGAGDATAANQTTIINAIAALDAKVGTPASTVSADIAANASSLATLDTKVDDLPTNAEVASESELAAAFWGADLSAYVTADTGGKLLSDIWTYMVKVGTAYDWTTSNGTVGTTIEEQ